MLIIGHRFNDKGKFVFIVSESGYDPKEITAEEMLSLDPELIEIYQIFGMNKRENLITCEPLQPKLTSMIFDYLDVGHDIAAMEIMEAAIKAKRELPIQFLFALINRILTPPINGTYRSKSSQYIFDGCEMAQRILKSALEVFGPLAFRGLWSTFEIQSKRYNYNKRNSEEEAELVEIKCVLDEYFDLWDFVKKSFTIDPSENEMKRKCRNMVLEILICIMEKDVQMRIENYEELGECIFLSTIPKDDFGNRTRLGPYLDILFDVFQETKDYEINQVFYMESIDMAGRLLNILIILSYCDQLVDTSSMIQQSYQRINRLDNDAFSNILQVISCTTFLSEICDRILIDSDFSLADEEYKYLRRIPGFRLDKMFHLFMKSRPLNMEYMSDIYRHVLVIIWRYRCYLGESTMRYSSLSDDTISKVISVCGLRPLTPKEKETKQKIEWAIELAMLNLMSDNTQYGLL
ncbi:hypothetical protein J3Q64DRAFT_1233712 [Phycomyces blakesleeanus]|uniref:Uncharacterized protein n=1 Tax=Phycomyces blakesleeanus TaxID=4837 RepID=A0ABR3BAW9_PHYBL